MTGKVAVVGLSPSSHDKAPWGNPEWEIWGLPWDARWGECHRLFEMHDIRLIREVPCRRPGYEDRLKDVWVPLYMQDAYAWLPCRRYPFEQVAADIGRAYWNSSIGYMLAMAITERPNEIGIWGVDSLDHEEYAYQRPNIEWLIGVAEGRGIKVTIPDESPLCKFHGKGIKFGSQLQTYVERYGNLG